MSQKRIIKPGDSGFVSNSSVIDYHGDIKPKTRPTAIVLLKDKLTPGSRSPPDKYDQDHFASTPLSQNEPESSITHRRKSGRLNTVDVNEGTRDLKDKKSHSHISNLQHLMAQGPGWIIVRILIHVTLFSSVIERSGSWCFRKFALRRETRLCTFSECP